MNVKFLLVSCCLEPTRLDILKAVVSNLVTLGPELLDNLTVFDNSSNQPNTSELLSSSFKNVYRSNRNVGLWSAIDWWLKNVIEPDPDVDYTYIIESDSVHYDFPKIWEVMSFLDRNPDIGACRLHEYSYENRHLYDKDRPHPQSHKNVWMSHKNKVTNKFTSFEETDVPFILKTTFLTQLPALNRREAMLTVFNKLSSMDKFSEFDFQRLYHELHPNVAIVDGGIFHVDLASWDARTKTVTGSWSTPQELAKIGYLNTRFANITSPNEYIVTKL